jgi:GNAT superfamily N-acetyltransferase
MQIDDKQTHRTTAPRASVRLIDVAVYKAFLNSHADSLFGETVTFDYGSLLSAPAKRALEALETGHRSGPRFHWGAFDDDALVGVHQARQQERGALLMDVSGVLPAYRRRGHYGRLLSSVVAFAKAREFQCVLSRHNAANNAVLIAKLKADFVVNGFEISDEQGLLVTLVLHFNEARRAAYAFRVGAKGLPQALHGAFSNVTSDP